MKDTSKIVLIAMKSCLEMELGNAQIVIARLILTRMIMTEQLKAKSK